MQLPGPGSRTRPDPGRGEGPAPAAAVRRRVASTAPAARRKGTALLLVANPFFRDDGWYDIRLVRFAAAFRDLGFDPVVYCRSYPGAKSAAGEHLGIRYRRVLFTAKAADPEETGKGVVPREETEEADGAEPRVPGDDDDGRADPRAEPEGAPLPRHPFILRALRWAVVRAPRAALRRALRMTVRAARRGVRLGVRLSRRAANLVRRSARRSVARVESRWLHYINLRFLRTVMRAASSEEPAFIYAADLNTLVAGYRLSRRFGVPLIYDSHEYFRSRAEHRWMSPPRKAFDKLLCSMLERRYLPRAAVVLSVSEGIIAAFRARIRSGNYLCVRNLPFRSAPPAPNDTIRRSLGLPEATRIALHIGFLTGGRSIFRIIEAARLLPDDIAVVFVGGGRLEEESRELARTLALEDKVFFLGHVPQEDVMDHARSADVGLCLIENTCLSYYHSLPNKLFQYIAAGLPVVCSDFPDMAALVRGFDLGLAVNPSRPEDIASAIRHIAGDAETRSRMSANAARAAREELNWENEMRKLREIEFLGGRESP